jgi:hypothetical protein
MSDKLNSTKLHEAATAHREPSREDWKVVDALWEHFQTMGETKQKTVFTSLISACPASVQAARNILTNEEYV